MNNVKIVKTEILSDNWYLLRKLTFDIFHQDVLSRQTREVYDRGNGATILLYNSSKKTVVLTRQFRLPTYVNGNADGYLIESCAGLLDTDDAENCIRRETEEETGFKIEHVSKVLEAYMSPGSVTELLYFFVAEYTKEMKISDGGGLVEDGEHIEVLEIPFTKALEMINTGEIRDGKTIILLQYVQINQLIK